MAPQEICHLVTGEAAVAEKWNVSGDNETILGVGRFLSFPAKVKAWQTKLSPAQGFWETTETYFWSSVSSHGGKFSSNEMTIVSTSVLERNCWIFSSIATCFLKRPEKTKLQTLMIAVCYCVEGMASF